MNLQNKTAFITGSTRGIGQQIAIGLAEKGCNIIVHGRTKANCQTTLALLEKYKVKTHSVYGDLAHPEEVEKVIQQVEKLNIDVEILYNNAAIMRPYRHDYWSHTQEDWSWSMQVNVFAPYAFCKAFIPKMMTNGFGRVINLVSGIQDQPELSPYSTSKAALAKLTKDLSVKLDETAVRINSLDPGWLQTDLGGEYADHPVEAVMPGALQPALIENDGPNGTTFFALNA
ncbi:SDR family NAD(P)-dependent oxidoreductase [Psychroflexus planctonicus]|uniref:Uncharacterized protein n=1 Tax=Psychroflexus planctonicus TaxID=1526575 RepID=A0ABQ1SEA3_9FLAO|nr:SDR family oxidoreductase [Psychroflexus planctonicus]GGE25495.1 hypothetical protein GCM10010832_02830 [Psychroflexus planctonicus]